MDVIVEAMPTESKRRPAIIGGVATADDLTAIFANSASTSDDDVFGILG